MPAGHFIARLELALHGHKHLDHFQNTRWQFVTALQFIDFFLKAALHGPFRFLELSLKSLDISHHLFIVNGQMPPVDPLDLFEPFFGNRRALFQGHDTGDHLLAHQHRLKTAVDVAFEDRPFVFTVL